MTHSLLSKIFCTSQKLGEYWSHFLISAINFNQAIRDDRRAFDIVDSVSEDCLNEPTSHLIQHYMDL